MATVQMQCEMASEPVSWRKRWRPALLNASFVMFWISFPCAYLGAVRSNDGLIVLSSVLMVLACSATLVTRK